MRRLPPLAAIGPSKPRRGREFTAAAAELGMTQAAVSYQVKSLEERLGSPLFVREKGRARLTPLGQRLLPPLSGAFDAIEAAFASHREEDKTATHNHHDAYLRQYLAGVAPRRVSDGASRPRGSHDHQQRGVRPARRRCRCRHSRRQRRLGGPGGTQAVRDQLHADGEPRLHRGCRTQARPQARAARHAAPEPHQSE